MAPTNASAEQLDRPLPRARLADQAANADWRWQLRHSIRTAEALASHLQLSADELAGAKRAEAQGMPLLVTPYYLALCDPRDPHCPIRRQIVPNIAEQRRQPEELCDPLGEQAHEIAPGLIRRYPDRALLVVADQCASYCRFCTRSRLVGGKQRALGSNHLDRALRAIKEEPQIREVILSGGEPLILSTPKLVELLAEIRAMSHVEVIRIATRVPTFLPQRINDALLTALRPFHPLWVMTHFNHPKELSAEAQEACARLADAGLPLMNQTVLLAGVNDTLETLESLLRRLVRHRVRPYYLHQMDPVVGAAHLRTPVQTGIDLMEALQGRLSGIALPKLIIDTPGGYGKVPIGPDWVVAREPGRITLRTHRGTTVDYLDPS